MRVTVSFQLKKSKSRANGICPIYGRCTMNGQRFEISTGFFLSSELWNESTQLVKGRTEDVRIMNNRLGKIRTRIQDIYNQLESIGDPFDVLTIKERFLGNRKEKSLLEVFDSVLKNIEARIDKDYSLGTLKHYRTTQKRLVEFIRLRTERKDIALSKIDFSFLNSFYVFLKTEKNVMPNTALTYHKHLKKVLNTAIASGYLWQCPYNSFKPTRNETNRDFLTLQELNLIQSKKIDIPRLDFIRNIFVFASYTGLSYSDIEKLSSNHIQKGSDGNDWIIIDRTKTESRCRIPLLPAAKEVFIVLSFLFFRFFPFFEKYINPFGFIVYRFIVYPKLL